MEHGKLFIVSGSSGSGKTTLVNQAIKDLKNKYKNLSLSKLNTYTSKSPRNNEVDGKDYYFITKKEFEEKIKENFFIEYSLAYNNYYGAPKSIYNDLSLGNNKIIIVDLLGASSIYTYISKNLDKNNINNNVFIWIDVDLCSLKLRLLKRNTENIDQINFRLSLAKNETLEVEKSKKPFSYRVNNNKTLDAGVKELEQILAKKLSIG